MSNFESNFHRFPPKISDVAQGALRVTAWNAVSRRPFDILSGDVFTWLKPESTEPIPKSSTRVPLWANDSVGMHALLAVSKDGFTDHADAHM
eukprot:1391672-Amorphochlora_amoeboformis.AAC.1